MLDRRDSRIVTLKSIERRKPEQLVAAHLPADAKVPSRLTVARGVGRGGERGHRGQGGRCGFFDPLRERIPRAPKVLAVKQGRLAMQQIAPMPGFNFDSAARVETARREPFS